MIPIQIIDTKYKSSNMGNNFNLINGKPGLACKGYNGNLNSWYYGINPEYKNKLEYLQNNIGILAQYDTVNSPYYKHVKIDEKYLNLLQKIANCNSK